MTRGGANLQIDTLNVHRQLAHYLSTENTLADFTKKALHLLVEDRNINQMAVAVYEETKGVITFPYSQNIPESTKPQAFRDLNSPLKTLLLKKGVLKVRAAEYLSHCQETDIVQSIPMIWAGCTLTQEDKVFGALLLAANSEESTKEIEHIFPVLEEFSRIFIPYIYSKIQFENVSSNEKKYRRLAESSMDITFQITLNGYLSYVSSNVASTFGLPPKDLIGRHFQSFVPGSEVPDVLQALANIAKDEPVKGLTISPQGNDRKQHQMEVNARPIYKEGNVIGAQGTLRDISEKHQAQQEIERLSFFPIANPMPVVEIDRQGKASYINPAGVKLLEKMNLDMMQVADILPPSFREDIQTALKRDTTIPSREVFLEDHYFLWSAFFLENQELIHYYGTDITTLKRTELELIEAQKVAVKNEQVKTLFLANMSHEIRTPLNSILGFSELIEEEVKAKYDQDLQSYFDIIRVSGKRLWHTVHEILDISQIETGTFSLKIESVELNQILRELEATFEHYVRDKDVELDISIPAEPLIIAADEYCATQALSNLLDNAIKYTHEGYVKVYSELADGAVHVIIEDTGIGMSKEYQKQMFNAFSQESTGYTKHFQGVGLGLALAHRYLKLIHGSIELTSTQDEGSTFTVSFPTIADEVSLDAGAEPKMAPALDEAQAGTKSGKTCILVVEDDPNSQKLAELTLKHDFDLHFADSVYDAKQVLEEHTIDLILLDLSLKGNEDGLDLARFVRSESSYAITPIIALTAHAFTSDRDRCLEAGCNEFMTKPFRRMELIENINNLT